MIGQGSGTGWTGNWGGDSATSQQVVSRTVTYAVPTTAVTLNAGSSQALEITDVEENLLWRELVTPFGGDEILVSVLIRLEPGFTIDDNDFLQVWLDNVTTGTHQDVPSFGIKANLGDGSGTPDVFIRKNLSGNAGDIVYVPAPKGNIAAGDTLFLVASFRKTGASTEYNFAELWMNPPFDDDTDPTDRPPADVSVNLTLPTGITSFRYVGLRTFGISGSDTFTVDRLRVATTWWEVYDDTGTLFVDLESFTAETAGPGMPVTLEWETSVEVDNVGFNIVREINGTREQLNGGLIAPLGDEFSGSVYTFTDTTVDPGWDQLPNYYLEDLDLYGKTTTHGPAAYKGSGTTDVVDWALYE